MDVKLLEGHRGTLFVWDQKRRKYRFFFRGPATVGVRIAHKLGLRYYIEVD